MHIYTVRADAGLSGVTEFCVENPLHSDIEISIIKDDEWGVTAKLHRDLFHCICRLFEEELADAGGTGEADLAHDRA